MKKRLKPIPEFATESEEHTFWESRKNDSTQYIDWSAAKVVSFPNLRPSTKTISLRLPEALLDTIRSRAHKLDIPYQSLMKLWLAEKATETTTDVRKSR